MPTEATRRPGLGVMLAMTVIVAAATSAFIVSYSGSHSSEVARSSIDDTLARVQQTGIIRAGYIVWPPAVIRDPNDGTLSGHFVDTMEFIAKESGARLEWQEVNWNTFVAALQGSSIDVVVAGTYVTIPRAKAVAFTRPLFLLGTAAIVKKGDGRFASPTDFNREGIVIACTQGTGEESWAKEYLPKARVKSLPGPNLDLALLEVLNGGADVAFQDSYTIRQFAQRQTGVEALFVDQPLNLTAVSWAIRSEDLKWKNFLDASIQYLEISSRLTQFEQKYNVQWPHSVFQRK